LLAAIVQASHDAIWSWDVEGAITSWNNEAERLFGYSAAEIIGKSLLILVPEERLETARQAIAKLLTGEFYGQYETVRMRKGGVGVDVELTVSPIRDEQGHIIGAATVCRDITERKKSDARLRLALEAAQLGAWDWNLLTNEMEYSERAKQIFGFPPAAPVTFEQVRDATHPEDLARTSEMSRRARDPAIREQVPYQYRIVRTDGKVRWVVAHGEAVFATVDGAERAVRYAGCIKDITAEREAADAAARSEARLRLALDAGKMGIWEYDIAATSLIGSPELNEVLGFDRAATPSIEQIRAGYLPGEQERVRAAARQAYEAGERQFELEFGYRWKDGTVHWLMVRAEFLSEGGKVDRLIGIICDISRLKHALEHQNFLINELNHRVKNSLAIVQSMALMTLKTQPPADFADAFTRRLAAFSATHDLLTRVAWERASLDDVIAAEIEPYSRSRFQLAPSSNPILLEAKAALNLGLAFHELATNAAKHGALTCSGGRVNISWRTAESGAGRSLFMVWEERGGPPPKLDRPPGFGSRLITSTIRTDLGGRVEFSYCAEGLRVELEVPIKNDSAPMVVDGARQVNSREPIGHRPTFSAEQYAMK
jgi:PAS domain S-box-containing protein